MYKHARNSRLDRTTRHIAGAIDDGPSPAQRAALAAYNNRIDQDRQRQRAAWLASVAYLKGFALRKVRGKGVP